MRTWLVGMGLVFITTAFLGGCGGSSQPDELIISRFYFPNASDPTLPCAQKQWDVKNAEQVQQIYTIILKSPKFDSLVPSHAPPYVTTYIFKNGNTIVLQGKDELNYLLIKGSYTRPAVADTPLILQIVGPSANRPNPPFQIVSCTKQS